MLFEDEVFVMQWLLIPKHVVVGDASNDTKPPIFPRVKASGLPFNFFFS